MTDIGSEAKQTAPAEAGAVERIDDFRRMPDREFCYAIVVARYAGQFVFVRHRERTTFELPAGHREPGEDTLQTAARELREETGAISFAIRPLFAIRSLRSLPSDTGGRDDEPVASLVCFAEISQMGPLDKRFEIAERLFCGQMPDSLTYPDIQPWIFRQVLEILASSEHPANNHAIIPDK
jgi:8-oxo-dGTP diphosphatase